MEEDARSDVDSSECELIGSTTRIAVPPDSEEYLRRELHAELQECQRALIRTRSEISEIEAQDRAVEEDHRGEVILVSGQLELLDSILAEEQETCDQKVLFAVEALNDGRKQLDKLQTETWFMEAQSQTLEHEVNACPDRWHRLEQLSGPGYQEEQSLAEGNAVLRLEHSGLLRELQAQRGLDENLAQRKGEAHVQLTQAKDHIESYNEWSAAIHEELRQVAAELQEDEAEHARESMFLETRAADLERMACEPTQDSRRGENVAATPVLYAATLPVYPASPGASPILRKGESVWQPLQPNDLR